MNETEKYQKFLTSQQASVKLEIALDCFFRDNIPQTHRTAYGTYLRQRIRPAVEALIAQDHVDLLEQLDEMGWFPEAQTDDFLKIAAAERKNESLIWLLQLKAQKTGFQKPDFSL